MYSSTLLNILLILPWFIDENIELPIFSDDNEKGMKGSGLLIINFKNKSLFKNLKLLIKDLSNFLKENDKVYKPKIRYL